MDARTRWRRLDAEHWIHVVGQVATVVLGLWTLWVALVGLVAGSSWPHWSRASWRRCPAG
jgi:hypothetical protein